LYLFVVLLLWIVRGPGDGVGDGIGEGEGLGAGDGLGEGEGLGAGEGDGLGAGEGEGDEPSVNPCTSSGASVWVAISSKPSWKPMREYKKATANKRIATVMIFLFSFILLRLSKISFWKVFNRTYKILQNIGLFIN
jgi:hypothetical protein